MRAPASCISPTEVFGDGPISDLVFVDQWFSNVDVMWDFAPLARLLNQLGAVFKSCDRLRQARQGPSCPTPIAVSELPTIEEVGSTTFERSSRRRRLRAHVPGLRDRRIGDGARLLAATYPERTSSLVLVDGCARLAWAEDYPAGQSVDRIPLQDLEWLRAGWGRMAGRWRSWRRTC